MKKPTYRHFALAAALAMALGPLTALTVASISNGTNGYVPTTAATSSGSQISPYQGKQLADVTAGAGSLDFFSTVLEAAEVKDLLRGDQQFTVFMPINEAFSSLGGESLSTMLNDPQRVKSLAQAHVVPGRVSATDLLNNAQLRSISGHQITAQVGSALTVNGASVIGSELAENGVVHYVDRLL